MQHRLDAGARRGDGVGRVQLALARGFGGGGAGELGQAGDLGLAEGEHRLAFVGEDVLAELRAQRGEALDDGGEAIAFGIGEPGPGADEIEVVALEDA